MYGEDGVCCKCWNGCECRCGHLMLILRQWWTMLLSASVCPVSSLLTRLNTFLGIIFLTSCCSSVQPRYSEEEVILLWLTCCVTWFLSITWSSSACVQCWCRGEWRLPGAASTQGMRTGAENQELSHTDTSNFRCGQHTSILKLFESAIKMINSVKKEGKNWANIRCGPLWYW